MVVGHNNRFYCKKMCGLLFGPQKSGHNEGVVILTGCLHGGVPLK